MSDASDAGDQFDFYPCLVDGLPASIYVNLRFAETSARAGADTRYTVALPFADAGSHGIGTAEEAEAMNACEEALIARVAEEDLVYAGRMRHGGIWEITFYGPAGHEAFVEAAARASAPGGRVQVRATADARWTYYVDLLLPDAERMRWMDDRRLVQILGEQGDRHATPRRVDHRVYFATEAARAAFVAAITAAGFTSQRVFETDGDRAFGVSVSRTDPIDLEHIHEVVMQVVDAAAPHDGRYDRWETSIER